ncbi:helix-turn-helix transcriptional regulator [Nitriliruptor alkaliphilus]|uniref:helix-turn-helix transcriptional regulator n=1 Tax=Nitriliruptor alkaliphilus TaxID=427918 RepID=UPI0006964B9E|nr:LuxR family transcriptional regulator [Nitriliruptor alkaliphilus]
MPELLEREAELAVLAEALSDASARHGSVVLISGEPGIGKTSLLRAWAADRGDARIMLGWCDDFLTSRTLAPFHDIARDERGPIAAAVAASDTGALFDALLEQFANPLRPTLLMIEDVHWADEATLDVIRYVGRRIAELPAVVAITYRDDELTADHPLHGVIGVLPSQHVRRLRPRRLSSAAVSTLLDGSGLDAEEVAHLTRGNPFFVTETVRSGGGTPGSVSDAVLARVRQLPASTRAAVELLSVVPNPMPLGQAAALVAPADLALAEQRGLLQVEADRIGFVHELARRVVLESLPRSARRTQHAAVLDHLLVRWEPDLAGLGPPAELGRADENARRAARVGQATDGAASVSALRRIRSAILHHAIELGRSEIVARHAPGAAHDAFVAGAHRQALSHQEAALRTVALLAPADLARLLLERAWSLQTFRRFAEGLDAARRSAEIYGELGWDRERCRVLITLSRLASLTVRYDEAAAWLAEAATMLPDDEPHVAAELEVNRLTVLHMVGRHEDVVAAGDAACAQARAVARSDLEAHAENYVGGSMVLLGDVEPGLERVGRAVVLAEDAGWTEAAARAHMNRAIWCVTSRRWDDAEGAIDAAITFFDDHDLPGHRVNSLTQFATSALFRGDWKTAAETLDAVEASIARGRLRDRSPDRTTLAEAITVGPRALLAVRRGADDVDRVLTEAWALALHVEAAPYIVPVACAAIELAWSRGRPADATPYLDLALDVAGDTLYRGWLAWRLPFVGVTGGVTTSLEPEATSLRGDWEAAARGWGALGMPHERAMELLRAGAVDETLEALGILDHLGARPAAAVARAQLRSLGHTRVPRGPQEAARRNPAGLTDRQLEVLQLVAQGRTNARIAEDLVVSIRTVDHHVSAGLHKLGVSGRHEVAAALERLHTPGATVDG